MESKKFPSLTALTVLTETGEPSMGFSQEERKSQHLPEPRGLPSVHASPLARADSSSMSVIAAKEARITRSAPVHLF